jgi:uncharacterized protein YdhG (YjbR/CyaY superfamily)
MFQDYLSSLNEPERKALERIIDITKKHVPDAKEGVSYGVPAFKYNDRPLLGFGHNKDRGLSLYPFDPRVISEVKSELEGFEVGKGYIRFSADNPVPENTVLLLLDLRLEYLR